MPKRNVPSSIVEEAQKRINNKCNRYVEATMLRREALKVYRARLVEEADTLNAVLEWCLWLDQESPDRTNWLEECGLLPDTQVCEIIERLKEAARLLHDVDTAGAVLLEGGPND